MLTIGPAKTNVYSVEGRPVVLKKGGYTTQTHFRLYTTKPAVTSDAVLAFKAAGDTDSAANARALALAARPVYLTNGTNGKACLVIGSPGGPDNPLADPVIVRWLTEGKSTGVLAEIPVSEKIALADFMADGRQGDLPWRGAGGVFSQTFGPSTGEASPSAAAIDFMLSSPRGLGYVSVFRSWIDVGTGGSPATGRLDVRYAVGDDASALMFVRDRHPTYADRGPMTAVISGLYAGAQAPLGYYFSELTTDKFSRYPLWLMDAWDVPYFGKLGTTPAYPWTTQQANAISGSGPMIWRASPRIPSLGLRHHAIAKIASLTSAFEASYGVEVTGTPLCACLFPHPLLTTVVGWVTGLPHEIPVMLLDAQATTIAENGVAVNDFWASADIQGRDLAKIFPLWNAPASSRDMVETAYGALNPDVWLRSVLVSGGVTYGGVNYDATVFARDAVRADSSLDEILFDDPEDDKPPVSYLSLAARAALIISEKKNQGFSLPLVSDQRLVASRSKIVFSGDPTSIVATQDGLSLDPGEAQVAISMGAPVEFTAPLTALEVATGFFDLPDWAAVGARNDEAAESHMYCLDESALTRNGTMVTSDDALARAIPVILGWGQEKYTAAVVGGLYGLHPPVTVSP